MLMRGRGEIRGWSVEILIGCSLLASTEVYAFCGHNYGKSRRIVREFMQGYNHFAAGKTITFYIVFIVIKNNF